MSVWSLRLLMVVIGGGLVLAGCAESTVSEAPRTGADVSEDASSGSDAEVTDGDVAAEPDVPVRDPWADDDGDGVPNQFDLCPGASDPGQEDGDGDGVGDACDNCPLAANGDQRDGDRDGEGDACEVTGSYDRGRDTDQDGVVDVDDNCRGGSNADQLDIDADGVGDVCDNCLEVANRDQGDFDRDGEGDACEPLASGAICDAVQPSFDRLQPNIYIVIDRSTSMRFDDGTGLTRMDRAKQGLDLIAEALHGDTRIGLATYPCAHTTVQCSNDLLVELLPIGAHTEQQIKDSYGRNYTAATCPHDSAVPMSGLDIEAPMLHLTETMEALEAVRNRRLLYDGADPFDASRPRAVVLVTDGETTEPCGGHPAALAAARSLAQDGSPVFVVGFNFFGPLLEELAQAGGTDAPGPDSYFRADDADQLVAALREVYATTAGCVFELNAPPPDPARVWVTLNGGRVPRDPSQGYSIEGNVVTLHGGVCQTLLQGDPQATNLLIEIGCAVPCVPEAEVCDYRDNDCNGIADEGCEGCVPEVCNGRDDDCDGETDEGCPTCHREGGGCVTDDDCCMGSCTNGSCMIMCYPIGVACQTDEDCCDTCVQQGDQKTCLSL